MTTIYRPRSREDVVRLLREREETEERERLQAAWDEWARITPFPQQPRYHYREHVDWDTLLTWVAGIGFCLLVWGGVWWLVARALSGWGWR